MKAKAIADVLYSNPQFRALIHDGSILARDVLSDVVEATATAIAPEENDLIELEEEATDVDGRAIKDDVEDTKKHLKEDLDSAKAQIKDTYDQATTSAMQTLKDLQERGHQFTDQVKEQTSEAVAGAKDSMQNVVQSSRASGQELAKSASQAANNAIAQLEKVTGVTKEEISQKLSQGISVDEIIQGARALAHDASEAVKKNAYKADQRGGKLVQDASDAAARFADDNDLAEKTDATIAKGKQKAEDLTSNARSSVSSVRETGEDTLKAVNEKTDKAGSKIEEGVSKVEDKAAKAKDSAESNLDGSKSEQPETTNHLKELGIVHEGRDQESRHLETIGIVHPNLDDEHVNSAATSTSKSTAAETQANAGKRESELVQQVIAQIREKVKDVQGVSQEDIEAAAKDLLEKTSQSTEEFSSTAQDNANEYAETAGSKGEEVKKQTKGMAENATKQASETADSVKKGASQLADQASEKTKDVAASAEKTSSNIARNGKQVGKDISENVQSAATQLDQQMKSIDPQELQDAVNNLLKTVKQKLEEKTGVTADDARQSLDWAIKRGEELAEEAMKKGKESSKIAKEKSLQVASTVQAKASEAGQAAQSGAIAAGAQAKHAIQLAPKDAPGQIHDTLDASQELVNTAIDAVKESTGEVRKYLAEKFPPKRRQAIQKHFQGLAVALRDNSDYSNGLDGLISIGRKYVDYTLTFTEELPSTTGEVVSTNAELDNAVRMTLKLIERFSNGVGFDGVQHAYVALKKDMQKEKGSEDFLSDCMTFFKKIVQDMKYASSKDAEKHGHQLLERIDAFSEDTGFKQDVNQLIQEGVRLLEGFASDKVLLNVFKRGQTCFKHLVMNEYGNFVFKKRVMKDFFNIIMPSALKLVQYIPISRIEFQNADVDVLIENLVFESSASHDQSFLPYRLRIDNHNKVEFLNAYKFESDYSNQITVKIEGLTLAVRDAGFYIRKKTGFWKFADSGLVDLIMDGPGIDIEVDLQMSTEDEDEDVTKDALFIVKDVRVKIHKLDFSTSGTKHGWLIGLVKPFIRGFIRRQVGLAVGAALKEQLTYYEYQLRMLQHRFKTAYIANNGQASFESFFRAVFTANAGTHPGSKGQFEVVVGGQGPLAGIYTKASIQQEFEESDAIAREHGRPHSWKNDIFDV